MSNSIEIIKDNQDKKLTYKILNAKLKESYTSGNFHEVINLSYAMIEDRLKTILDLLYIIEDKKEKLYPCDSIDRIIRPILKFNLDGDKKNIYKINNISTKLNIIKKILKTQEENIYIRDCKYIFEENIKIKEMLSWIKQVEKWCKVRNEIIHSAFNKNYESFNFNLEDVAKKGYDLSNIIKKYANKIKTNKQQISVKDKWSFLNKISKYNLSLGILNEYNNFYLEDNPLEKKLFELNIIQNGELFDSNINNIVKLIKHSNKNRKEVYIIDFIKQLLECEYNALYYLNYIIEKEATQELYEHIPVIIKHNFKLCLIYSNVFKKEIKEVLISFLKYFNNITVSDIPEKYLITLRKDKSFLIKWGEVLGTIMFDFDNPYLYIEKEFYNDKEFLLNLVNNNNLIPAHLVDLDFLLKIELNNIYYIMFRKVVLKNNEYKDLLDDKYKGFYLIDFIKKDGSILEFVSNRIKDKKKYVKEAVLNCPSAFVNASKRLRKDEELFKIFLNNIFDYDDYTLHKYLIPFYNNKEIALKVLEVTQSCNDCFSEEILNLQEVKEIIKKSQDPFADFDDLPFDDDINFDNFYDEFEELTKQHIEEAIKTKDKMIEENIFRDKIRIELEELNIRSEYDYVSYLDNIDLIDCLIILNEFKCYKNIPSSVKTSENVLRWLRINIDLFPHIEDVYKNDKSFILELLKQDILFEEEDYEYAYNPFRDILPYIDNDLMNDKELVIELLESYNSYIKARKKYDCEFKIYEFSEEWLCESSTIFYLGDILKNDIEFLIEISKKYFLLDEIEILIDEYEEKNWNIDILKEMLEQYK